jgi:hypothetical protein
MILELEVFPGLLAAGSQIDDVRLPRGIGHEKGPGSGRHRPWLDMDTEGVSNLGKSLAGGGVCSKGSQVSSKLFVVGPIKEQLDLRRLGDLLSLRNATTREFQGEMGVPPQEGNLFFQCSGSVPDHSLGQSTGAVSVRLPPSKPEKRRH